MQGFLQTFLNDPDQDLDAYLGTIQTFWDSLAARRSTLPDRAGQPASADDGDLPAVAEPAGRAPSSAAGAASAS